MTDHEIRTSAVSRAALARLAVASEAAAASDSYRTLAADSRPTHREPGELAGTAWRLFEQARGILRAAVIADRLAGASWETIGANLGEISKQAAHERYGAAETVFRRAALMAWLIPERAGHQLGDLADPHTAQARLTAWLRTPPGPGPGPGTAVETGSAAEVEDFPFGLPAMTDAERAGLLTEAANLLKGAGPYRNAGVTDAERYEVELGLARRRVELYEEIAERRPDDPEPAALLAGARARLAALEAG
ncbi:hypothetical protein AB0C28_20780 [Nonomuraea sp. NPDC048892]|uniref:hypothetical protein n=1 Tax=Nonomuraea sp. NPDC048892 TaxID=3154624 RepID=UPI000B0352BC